LLHTIKQIASNEDDRKMVTLATMEEAIQIVEWCKAESIRCFQLFGECETVHEFRHIRNWIEQRKDGSIVVRDLLHGMRHRFKTSADAETVLNEMAKAGFGAWQRVPPRPDGGRPTRRFSVISHTTTPSNPGKT